MIFAIYEKQTQSFYRKQVPKRFIELFVSRKNPCSAPYTPPPAQKNEGAAAPSYIPKKEWRLFQQFDRAA